MQRSVRVHRLHVVLDDVVPLHSQVDEALGLGLLSFSVEDVMPCRLVLDRCVINRLLGATDKLEMVLLC